MLALRELLFTIYLHSGLRPSVWGKVTSENLQNLRYNANICYVILALIYSESAHPITPIYLLKLRSGTILKFLYFLVVNNNNYSSLLLTISYSGSAYPIIPVELLKATLYDHFGLTILFLLIYTYIYYKVVCMWVCLSSPSRCLDRSEPNFAYHINVGPHYE